MLRAYFYLNLFNFFRFFCFCEAAWGGSCLVSRKQKHLMASCERYVAVFKHLYFCCRSRCSILNCKISFKEELFQFCQRKFIITKINLICFHLLFIWKLNSLWYFDRANHKLPFSYRSDCITWDSQKMMSSSLTCSVLLVKEKVRYS